MHCNSAYDKMSYRGISHRIGFAWFERARTLLTRPLKVNRRKNPIRLLYTFESKYLSTGIRILINN